jgi:hypothetical protein
VGSVLRIGFRRALYRIGLAGRVLPDFTVGCYKAGSLDIKLRLGQGSKGKGPLNILSGIKIFNRFFANLAGTVEVRS